MVIVEIGVHAVEIGVLSDLTTVIHLLILIESGSGYFNGPFSLDSLPYSPHFHL